MPRSCWASLAVAVSLALSACATLGEPPDDLLRAQSFCIGCTAYTGRVVSGDRAFAALLWRSDAAAQLDAVFARGNIQAKMYALAGLREVDRERFEHAFATMRNQKFSVVKVATVEPATSYSQPGAVILKQIRDGEYKLLVDEWRRGPFRGATSRPPQMKR